eukprot:EG_transcript_16069
MPFITVELLRKRAEHNEGCLRDLKEITLHQQDLEQIDVINDECKELEILYLQNNLIPRIENLFHMKFLWYLNLAINNIRVIENLEPLESLKKLDLTLNFIGELTSIQKLQANPNLRQLHLTGNNCTQIPGYRYYVIDTLPQLEQLDSEDITKSERIRARQEAIPVRAEVEEQLRVVREEEERKRREQELGIERPRPVDEKGEKLYSHTPEDRLAAYRDMQEEIEKGKTKEKSRFDEIRDELKVAPLTPEEEMAKYGRYLQRNQAGLKYEMNEVGAAVELLVNVPKFISTTLIDCDVQPTYIRITIKGKVLQLTLAKEVAPDRAVVTRGQVDGRLKVLMPFADPNLTAPKPRGSAAKATAPVGAQPAKLTGPAPPKRGFANGVW